MTQRPNTRERLFTTPTHAATAVFPCSIYSPRRHLLPRHDSRTGDGDGGARGGLR
ncbi:hypothetical protein E2C01_082316 [Portunus trituberculatus]|uniref:Uncharacterized protein n=1 Tax=Portunus trituberculatus TaxID=210409 RepID=A0A5B7J4L1_PORTR|nr:hypothetical protein [Portunus trituberculatus]